MMKQPKKVLRVIKELPKLYFECIQFKRKTKF